MSDVRPSPAMRTHTATGVRNIGKAAAALLYSRRPEAAASTTVYKEALLSFSPMQNTVSGPVGVMVEWLAVEMNEGVNH